MCEGLNKDIPECFVKNRDGENFEVTRELYEVLAALNEARRKRDCPPSLSECEPKFEHEHIAQGGWFGPERFNFEGTAKDNYCLGSKGHAAARGERAYGGRKYYVGTTNDKGRRHREHEDTALNGAPVDRATFMIWVRVVSQTHSGAEACDQSWETGYARDGRKTHHAA